jgi:hypothetical protein
VSGTLYVHLMYVRSNVCPATFGVVLSELLRRSDRSMKARNSGTCVRYCFTLRTCTFEEWTARLGGQGLDRPRDLCFTSLSGNSLPRACFFAVARLARLASLTLFHHNYSLPRFRKRRGRSTCRARTNSATFFPNTSTVLVTPTPRSNRLRKRKCTAWRPGSSKRSIASCD